MYTGGKTYAPDSLRATTLFVHDASPLDVLTGVSTTPQEITRFATRVTQSAQECSVGLSWHDELYGASQPRAGQVLEILTEGVSYWIGIIQAVSDYRLSSGTKSMTILARSRDATPAWRDVKRATDVYPTATPLAYIAKQIAQAIGLAPAEITLPDTGASTVQSNTQLADLSPWAMLTTLYQPAGLEPFVDCRGRLKCISRDIQRPSDVVLSDNRRLIDVSGSKSKPALTEVSIKWLDPNLTEVAQQDRMLDRATITAGFFQLHQVRDVFFSADQTQRARDTHLVIRQSANSGLIHFCTEEYEQDSTTAGKIKLTTSLFAPALATTAMGAMLASSYIPDGVAFGHTIPYGRIVHDVAEGAMMLTMMSMGTGVYEVWGTPFDYVHARNTTTAYNPAANVWEIQPQEIENDFVLNEAQAQSFAIRELIYQARSASAYNLSIVDDTRIEPGDLVEISDGTRVYVTDYSRDLSNGAPAALSIQGFVATVNSTVGTTQVVSPVTYPPVPPVAFPSPPPSPVVPPTGGGSPDTITIGPVDVNAYHTIFEIRFYRDRGNNPVSIQIDEMGYFGRARLEPVQFGSTGDIYYHMLDINGMTIEAKYGKQSLASCSAKSTPYYKFCDPEFAFRHDGFWRTNTTTLTPERYHSLTVTTHEPIRCHGYVLYTSDTSRMPRDWDFYIDGKLSQVVRELDAYQSGGPVIRDFSMERNGIRYYRLNIKRSYIQYAAPLAPVWTTFIQSLEMLPTVGGIDLCAISGGIGDAEQSFDCAGGRDAFNGNGWQSKQENGTPAVGPQNWVRYAFPSETIIAAYAITAGGLGVSVLAPYDWTFEASIDGANWTVVDTQSGITFTPGERKEFDLAKTLVSAAHDDEGSVGFPDELLMPPQLTAVPVVGVPVGFTLVGEDRGIPDIYVQWCLDGVAILEANDLTYTPVASDAGHKLHVAVYPQTELWRSPGRPSTQIVIQSISVLDSVPIFYSQTALDVTPHVHIAGGYRPALLNCVGPVTVTRLWYSSYHSGITTSTYTPSDSELDTTIWVTETATNANGSATSDYLMLYVKA